MTTNDAGELIERYVALATELEDLVGVSGIEVDDESIWQRAEGRQKEIEHKITSSEESIDTVRLAAVDALASVRTLVDAVGNVTTRSSSERMCYQVYPGAPTRYYDEGAVQYWLCEHPEPHRRFVG